MTIVAVRAMVIAIVIARVIVVDSCEKNSESNAIVIAIALAL